MGDLIVMSRVKPQPARDFIAGHSAEILFFTGVRYYRLEEAAEAPPVKRRRSPDQRRATKRIRGQRLEALA